MAVKITNKSAQSQIATQSIAQKPEAQTPPAKATRTRRRITNRGYKPEVFEKIFQLVAMGETLAEACRRPGMPNTTTVQRRMQVDDLLRDQYNKAVAIKFHGLVDELPDLPNKAIEGLPKVSAADRLTAAKQRADNIKWIASKVISEFAGDSEAGGHVVLNILNSPDAQVAEPGALAPAVPAQPGGPKLKIVGLPAQPKVNGGGNG
ncbi:hypothetical protein R69608_01411 [Paraburkholderia nemoris]|uniref:terminase small subunit-like protein n=1 Tax=Paraburkholderia nemoris TaxID=2793076 RepID=UPI001913E6D4|nr:hypothetical protein [Paraburkholderia nemoris]MBK5148035.1 hypothetical protein [Burkholderia sp. R-69608]CAE6876081.1 hypothetical protein R69608_01411 [Paraburkholderia nemoris]